MTHKLKCHPDIELSNQGTRKSNLRRGFGIFKHATASDLFPSFLSLGSVASFPPFLSMMPQESICPNFPITLFLTATFAMHVYERNMRWVCQKKRGQHFFYHIMTHELNVKAGQRCENQAQKCFESINYLNNATFSAPKRDRYPVQGQYLLGPQKRRPNGRWETVKRKDQDTFIETEPVCSV